MILESNLAHGQRNRIHGYHKLLYGAYLSTAGRVMTVASLYVPKFILIICNPVWVRIFSLAAFLKLSEVDPGHKKQSVGW